MWATDSQLSQPAGAKRLPQGYYRGKNSMMVCVKCCRDNWLINSSLVPLVLVHDGNCFCHYLARVPCE